MAISLFCWKKRTCASDYIQITIQSERRKIMLKLFISSHGHLASGIKSSLDILLGNSDNVVAFDAYVNQDNLADQLNKFYETVNDNDEVILLSDLYGGSVNNEMMLHLNQANTRLVTGVNLALVLELACKQSVTDEQLKEIIEQSRTVLTQVVVDENITVEQDEFF